MERTYTRGPWIYKHSESKDAFNVIGTALGGKYKIARCPYVVVDNKEVNQREKDESEANAKLIAAAPTLLELIQWISKVTKSPEIGINCDAAIKKATQ